MTSYNFLPVFKIVESLQYILKEISKCASWALVQVEARKIFLLKEKVRCIHCPLCPRD